MVIKVGINGFGRVGRVIFRTCYSHSDLQIAAINDPAIEADYICYLMKFDSTHGRFAGDVSHTNEEIKVNDKCIKIYRQKYPTGIPWAEAGVEYVVEASGMFTSMEKASGHLASGTVKRVIVTAPSNDVPMIILGVNDNKLGPDHKILSCGSSTLYCLAPIIKVLEDNYGVEAGFITSIHAMTPSLKPLDGLCLRGKHWRDHRSIMQNIIPATTGACKALGKIIPQVRDKVSGLAFRVPIVNVSLLDLTVQLHKPTSLDDIICNVEQMSKTKMKDIMSMSMDETVSSDFMSDTHSCIFDAGSSQQLKPDFFKIVCWYENEYSYACRVVDLIHLSENQLEGTSRVVITTKVVQAQSVVQQTEVTFNDLPATVVTGAEQDAESIVVDSESKPIKHSREVILKESLILHHTETQDITDITQNKAAIQSFKIWNEQYNNINSQVMRQNRSSFFQTCLQPLNSSGKAQERLEKVKEEFSKMVDITEKLLKKSQINVQAGKASTGLLEIKTTNISNVEIKSTDATPLSEPKCIETKSKTANKIEDEFISAISNNTMCENSQEMCENNVSDLSMVQTIKSSEVSFQTTLVPSLSVACGNDEAKERLKELENDCNSLETSTTSFISKMSRTFNIIKNFHVTPPQNQDNYEIEEDNKEIEKDNQYTGTNVQILKPLGEPNENTSKTSIGKCDNTVLELEESKTTIQNYADQNKAVANTADITEFTTVELAPSNFQVHANNNTDENPHQNVKIAGMERLDEQLRKRNISFHIIDKQGTTVDGFVSVEDNGPSEYTIAPTTEDKLNKSRVDKKQDIYDKLDSASETDSNNSLKVKKSQVIKISDLTNSLDDFDRLDKICRIMEISDELSDKLFAPLDDIQINNKELARKKWSFRDLCDRIHLDEFCNQVFGK